MDRYLNKPSAATVGIIKDDQTTIIDRYLLEQNYPNPFDPSTSIRYTISDFTYGYIDVNITDNDMLWRKIKTLVKQTFHSGSYQAEWDGTDSFSQSVASGIYVYRLYTTLVNNAEKMVLMR